VIVRQSRHDDANGLRVQFLPSNAEDCERRE
jgi:hypothetical protein